MTIHIPAWVDGKLIAVEKLEVHQRALRHKAVSVFVMQGDKLLIQQRAMSKYHTPGIWANTCCTHPEWDEPSRDCAIRRLDEELGIKGLNPEYRDQIEYRAAVGNGLIEHEVVDVYLAESSGDLKLNLNPSEVKAVRWITFADLHDEIRDAPQKFTPWLKIYLDEHSESIFGDRVPA